MKKFLIALLLVTSFLQISCTSDTVNNSPTTNPVDVYVAGSKNGQACYWKNNQLFTLDSGNLVDVTATKIIVSNGDVYLFGIGFYSSQPSVYHNLFWKNGVLTNLTLSYSTNVQVVKNIGDMDVVGDDVYFCGITKIQDLAVEQYEIAYWKNGVKTIISGTSNLNGPTTNIKVLNNDVYVRMIRNGLYGYYKNSIYNDTPNAPSSPRKGFAVNNNEIYTIYQTGNMQSTIYNITNNTFTPIGVNSNAFYTDLYFDDNNNMYYKDMQSQSIYKNGVSYCGVNTIIGDAIIDFKILNNNLYTLENRVDFGSNNFDDIRNIVFLNGVNILEADLLTEQFNSLFIVQN